MALNYQSILYAAWGDMQILCQVFVRMQLGFLNYNSALVNKCRQIDIYSFSHCKKSSHDFVCKQMSLFDFGSKRLPSFEPSVLSDSLFTNSKSKFRGDGKLDFDFLDFRYGDFTLTPSLYSGVNSVKVPWWSYLIFGTGERRRLWRTHRCICGTTWKLVSIPIIVFRKTWLLGTFYTFSLQGLFGSGSFEQTEFRFVSH